MATIITQKITSGDKTQVTYSPSVRECKSMTFTNTHTGAVSISLYITSQLGTDKTSTTVLAAEPQAASRDSVDLAVDTVSATADAFLNERVYKSDGTLYGVCTAVNSTTEIVFSGGLVYPIANNEVLYTGTRYTILNNVKIPTGVSLKLHLEDLNFDITAFNLYIDSDNASGLIDIITRY